MTRTRTRSVGARDVPVCRRRGGKCKARRDDGARPAQMQEPCTFSFVMNESRSSVFLFLLSVSGFSVVFVGTCGGIPFIIVGLGLRWRGSRLGIGELNPLSRGFFFFRTVVRQEARGFWCRQRQRLSNIFGDLASWVLGMELGRVLGLDSNLELGLGLVLGQLETVDR